MANYDPQLRRETWCFQILGTQRGRRVYQRLGYNLVSYDDDPVEWIEPVNEAFSTDLLSHGSGDCTSIESRTHYGRVSRFEYFDGRPFEGITVNAELNVDSLGTDFGKSPNDFGADRGKDT